MDKKFSKNAQVISSLLLMILLSGGASIIGILFRKAKFPETNIVIIYILSVLLTARLTYGYVYGIMASLIATFAFNYLFTSPYFTFSVNDPNYIITFAIMTITAIITSALTSRVKQSAIEAEQKELETRALYQLTNQLTDAKSMKSITEIATSFISDMIDCHAACLCFDESGVPENTFIEQDVDGKFVYGKTDDIDEMKNYIEAIHTDYYVGTQFYYWPLYGQENVLGIIRIPKEKAEILSESQKNILRVMTESTALAMDRYRQAQQKIKTNEEMIQERYRGNLLRAISHDLRTPLSGIMGTSEMLMDMTKEEDPRFELERGIYQDADWLKSLVENILNLTRLQEGRLILNKELEAVEEIIGSSIAHINKRYINYDIKVDIPQDLILIPMDGKLIEQVLINLLDNAIKHCNTEDEIKIKVENNEEFNEVKFSVTDEGEGIREEDLPNIFTMFYTSNTRSADAKHGIGLGLTICQAIIKAHGGTIEGKNRYHKKGAVFSFTLPIKED